jgi:hypothetical protein
VQTRHKGEASSKSLTIVLITSRQRWISFKLDECSFTNICFPLTIARSPLSTLLAQQEHCARSHCIHTNVETYIYPYTHRHTNLLNSSNSTQAPPTHTYKHTQSHHVQPHYHFSWCCCSSPYYTHLRTMLWLP